MKSETSIVAAQCRIQEWAEQIRECQNRPEGMSVAEWCKDHGITKANYYYRLRRVRRAYLDSIPEDAISNPVIQIKQELLAADQADTDIRNSGLEICFGDCVLKVTETTSVNLLSRVIGVIRNAQ